ncbi:hypothetical protein Tco_0506110 [Tanacetum coccineum]
MSYISKFANFKLRNVLSHMISWKLVVKTFDQCSAPCSSETTIDGYMENYKLFHKTYTQLYAEAEAVQQHQNEVNEIRAERLAHHNNLPESEVKQLSTLPESYYDQKPAKKIYKPTNNNLRSSSNTSRANQDNSPRINRGIGYDNQREVNVAGALGKSRMQLNHKEKDVLCKQEEAGDQRNAEKMIEKDDMMRLVEIILFIIDSGCSKHMTGNLKLLSNFVEKFLGTVKFGNDQIASILEVAFRKSTCYIRDLKGNDLLTGSCGTYIYSITLKNTSTPNPIYLMAKASSSQAWLCHHRLSYLNFDTINLLSNYDIVESINGKKYVLVNVDDYSRYTWTHFLRSKDETPKVLINFPKLVQRGLHAQGILLSQELTSLSPGTQSQESVSHTTEILTLSNELDFLFSLMFDELLNGTTLVVLKSSAIHAADAPGQHQQQNTIPSTSTNVAADTPPLNIQTTSVTTSQAPTQALTVTATENINQAETQKENAQVDEDEFINIFSTLVHEQGETSSRYVESLNMYTLVQI